MGGDFLKDLPLERHNFLNCLAENHQKDGQFDVVRSSLVKDKLDLWEKSQNLPETFHLSFTEKSNRQQACVEHIASQNDQ